MYRRSLKKPDGRALYLYSASHPISEEIVATSPRPSGPAADPHLRWHPLRGEWVAYASHRQNRTFLPPKDYSPLAVTTNPDFPTEMPPGDYDVAVFENLFPSLCLGASSAPELFVPTMPANGTCEVVVFTQDPDQTLATLPISRIELLLQVMGERCADMGARENIQYALPFENRGVEMGVTLHHPHGQIYGYPFVPSVPARMLKNMKAHWDERGTGLFEAQIKEEKADGRRIVCEEGEAISFVPVCARYPYETWVAPQRPVAQLSDLGDQEIRDLAKALKATLQKHDGLWHRPQPYLMVLFQGPLDGKPHPEAHVHFQIYPPYRTKDRLKYLAGTELGAGMFVNDSLPEEKAAELKAVEVGRG